MAKPPKYPHVPAQYPTSGRAQIAFVGEAPSFEEGEKGIPLVGPSGGVFDAILRTANLPREEFLVTNLFDEQLPDNEVANWCLPLKEAREAKATDLPPIGNAGWLAPEHRWHLDRLRQEILDVQPKVIVPLGGTALWAFTGESGITKVRGNVMEATRLIPGAKLVPTFHPAAIMRQWKFFTTSVLDIQKAVQEAKVGKGLELPVRRLVLEPTLAEVRVWFSEHLPGCPLLSVDIETGWGQITAIGFATSEEDAICIPFVDLRKPNRSYWATLEEELEAQEIVREVLEGPTPKLGQNYGGFDAFVLLKNWGMRTMNMHDDTRLLHHALYPELPKDLAFMGSAHSKQGVWKTWRGKASEEKREG